MLLQEFFEATVERLASKTALVAGGQRYTYAVINDAAARLAGTLQQRGLRRGDRVAIFADNGIEAIVSIFAALKAGAVFMPINALTKGDKLTYLLNDARAACLVTVESLRDVWSAALARNRTVHTGIVAGLPASEGNGRLMSYASATDMATSEPVLPPVIDQDLASIIYTSGSTGEAKGVMLTHLNMTTAVNSVNRYLGMTVDDVILCAMPIAFDYGLYQVLMGFKVGARVVLERSFSFPVKILEQMEREEVTVFPGVPTMFSMIMGLKNLQQFDLSRLRMMTNTAAALSERHIRDLRALFPRATLYSMYGLTECKRVTYLAPEQLDIRPTSVGRGMPNEEVWLVDEAGKRLPNGSTGELVIRGSHVMRGYWEKPEQTAKRLKPGPYPGELVLHSGDIFRSDEEGYLYFVARKDDIIKSRGEKVSPREVENVLYGLDAVQDAAVVGIPDNLLGQAIKAYVVLRPGCQCGEKDLLRHCQAKLEGFMVPKYMAIVAELPKTNTGKIKNSELR